MRAGSRVVIVVRYPRPMSRLAALIVALVTVSALAQEQYSESITVRRTVFTIRLVDAFGKPILGLEPKDFVATIGGTPADVVSVKWIPETARGREISGTTEEETLDLDFLDALAQLPSIPVEKR